MYVVYLLIAYVQEPLISLCKGVILHLKSSLEEVAICGSLYTFPLDPLVPALVVCQKMSVLKVEGARLSHENMLTSLEELPKLQELVLDRVSVRDIVSDRLCLPLPLVEVCLHCNCIVIVWYSL